MKPADDAARVLDATGLLCPEPVFRARQCLAAMRPGDLLEIRADDPLAEVDLAVFCERTGHEMVSIDRSGDCRVFVLRKTGATDG